MSDKMHSEYPDLTDDALSSSAPTSEAPQAEALLQQAIDLIGGARPMPLSTSSMINKEEVLEVLVDVQRRLPDELRAARWLLKERDEYLQRVTREGDEILDMARDRAARMVERTEVVKAAEARARQVVTKADDDARRMRLEVEDYCDHKLGSFEAILDRTRTQVVEGRAKLQRTALDDDRDRAAAATATPPPPPSAESETAAQFFDQDPD